MVLALWANASLRAFSGFLLMFLAFLLRENPVGELDDTLALGLVAGAAAIGNATGTTIGSRLRTKAPLTVIVVVLAIVTGAAAAGALIYGVVTVLVVGFAAGLAQSLGKLSLDAIVLMFKPPFAFREFIEQTWFVTRVSLVPTILMTIPLARLTDWLIARDRRRRQARGTP